MSPIRNILVLYHRGIGDEVALDRAVSLTRKVEGSLIVAETLGSVSSGLLGRLLPPSPRERDAWDRYVAEREAHFARLTDGIRRLNVPVRCRVLADGAAHESVIRAVVDEAVDLVILTAPDQSLAGAGTPAALAARLMRDCPCPVWLAHPGTGDGLARVVAAVGLPEDPHGDHATAEKVLSLAGILQDVERCKVDIVHAWDFVGAERERALSELPRGELARLVRRQTGERRARIKRLIAGLGLDGVDLQVHVIRGAPHLVIPEFASRNAVDLVVMGNGPKPAFAGLRAGSRAREMAEDVACSILAVGGTTAVRRPLALHPHPLA